MPAGDLTKDEIVNFLHESRARLISLGVKSIGLFGSFVRGDSSLESDVDVLIDDQSDG